MFSTPGFSLSPAPGIPCLRYGAAHLGLVRCTIAPRAPPGRSRAPRARRARSPPFEGSYKKPPHRHFYKDQSLSERVEALEKGGSWHILTARAIVEDASDGRDWQLAVRALHAFESNGFFSSRTLSTGVITALAAAGRVEECVNLLTRLFEPSIINGTEKRELSEQIMLRRRPDCRMVVIAANCAVRMLRVNTAVAMVQLMEKHGVPANAYAYSVLIKGFGRAGRPADVRATLRKARSEIMPDLALYNAAVDAFVRCGEWELARKTMLAAEAAGLTLDSRSYNPLFRAVARAGRLQDAFALVGEMQQRGVQPSPVTLNALIQTSVAALEWAAARRLLTRALQLNRGAWTQHKAVAYTTLIAGLAANRDIAGATALLGDMAATLQEHGDSEEDMTGTAPLSVPLAAILTALLEHGTVTEAWELFRGTQKRLKLTLAPDAYNAVIRGLARRGDLESAHAAVDLLHEMLAVFWAGGKPAEATRGRDSLPYELTMAHNSVMDGFVRLGRCEEAERILREMRERGLLPTAISYTTVLNGYGKQKDLDAARRILVEMRQEGLPADRVTMNAFLGACVRVGDLRAAEKVFADMTEAGGSITPNITSYSALIAAYACAGDVELAWRTYEDMKDKRISPNERLLDRMLAMCVVGASRKNGAAHAPALMRSRRGGGEQWTSSRVKVLFRDMERCKCSPQTKTRWKRVLAAIG